jgi:hypothetical protein
MRRVFFTARPRTDGNTPAVEPGDVAERGELGPGFLQFQGERIDGADERGDVGAELGEFPVLGLDRLLEPGDGGAEPGLVAVVGAAVADALVELVFRSVWRWVSALRGTPASMASATTVSAPLERSGAPSRIRSIAARIWSRSLGSVVIRRPCRG